MFAGADLDQGVGLQRAEKAAEVSRVEIEPGSQHPYLAAVFADLPQQPRLPERSVSSEVVVVEGADALGDGPVEPSHTPHQLLVHSSDSSQTFAALGHDSADANRHNGWSRSGVGCGHVAVPC